MEYREELHHSIDTHSRTILSRHIELLLDYCTRYYERQFITRENKNKTILRKMEQLLENYIELGKLQMANSLHPTIWRKGSIFLLFILQTCWNLKQARLWNSISNSNDWRLPNECWWNTVPHPLPFPSIRLSECTAFQPYIQENNRYVTKWLSQTGELKLLFFIFILQKHCYSTRKQYLCFHLLRLIT